MRSRRGNVTAALLLAAATLAGGCSGGGGSATAPPPTTTAAPSRSQSSPPAPRTSTVIPGGAAGPCHGAPRPATYHHVVWIWMENHSAATVLRAPFTKALAATCAVATGVHAVGSPSLPNYIGATSGGTWGIHDDAAPGSHRLAVDNLFRQVRAAGGTERSFEESMPAPCTLHGGGRYAVKHNPAAYYIGDGDRAACNADDVPFDGLDTVVRSGNLPTFAFVTPDLCHDTHDCSVATGDRWLAQWVSALLAGPNFAAGDTAIFVTWDEPTPVALIAVAPDVAAGTTLTAATSHYGLLRTTEELLGLPLLGKAGVTPSLRGPLGV